MENLVQFAYLQTSVPLWSFVQIKYFLQLGSIFYRNPQNKRRRVNQEKLNVDRQIFKDVI